jgi:hypothetical protein
VNTVVHLNVVKIVEEGTVIVVTVAVVDDTEMIIMIDPHDTLIMVDTTVVEAMMVELHVMIRIMIVQRMIVVDMEVVVVITDMMVDLGMVLLRQQVGVGILLQLQLPCRRTMIAVHRKQSGRVHRIIKINSAIPQLKNLFELR